MYARCLDGIGRYVQGDLKNLSADPTVLLSGRPLMIPSKASCT
jgi:hypothetical protein